MAGGFTMHMPLEDKMYRSKKGMEDEIVTLLGGRVAESIIIGDISTGASNDLERSTETARKMVTKYGMSETLGPVVFGASDAKSGACGSVCDLFSMDFNHHPTVEKGVREEEAAALLSDFFQQLRVTLRSRPKWKKKVDTEL